MTRQAKWNRRKNSCWMFAVVSLAVLFILQPAHSQETPKKPDGKKYQIAISQPKVVGQQRRVAKKMTQVIETIVKKDGEKVKETKTENTIDFDAIVQVLEVDARGGETKMQLTIVNCQLTTDENDAMELVPPGTVVVGEMKNQRTIYRPKKESAELSDLAAGLLPKIIAAARDEPSDDEIFGSKSLRQVGEKWSADAATLVQKFRSVDPNITAKQVKGGSELFSVKDVNGKEHIDLKYRLIALPQSLGDVPPDMAPSGARMELVVLARYPADGSTDWISQVSQLQLQGKFLGKPDSPVAGLEIQFRTLQSSKAQTVYKLPQGE